MHTKTSLRARCVHAHHHVHNLLSPAYSKANAEKFSSCQCFSSAVTKAFAETGAEVSHWACCQEHHRNMEIHYHMAVNMTKLRCWKSVKEQLKSKHDINVHFSGKSLGYIATYRYICKSGKEVLHSENHPDLRGIGSPRTKAYMKVNKAKNSVTWKSGELKHSLSAKGTKVSLAKVKTKCHLQMLQSTFLTIESGHTVVCKL